MNISEMFEAEGDGSEDNETLYSLSSEFLEAAYVLQRTPPIRLSYSLVIYYLLGHSAELMLKSFLQKNGCSIKELRTAGHNLNSLIAMAKDRGLPESIKLVFLEQLADIYKDKKLEYRRKNSEVFPNDENLYKELSNLKSAVFDSLY